MKIWIDLTNSPHINFFKPFIQKWKNDGHEVILTTRDFSNTIDLIKQNEWTFTEIGGHAGKNKFKKLLYFPKRVFKLYRFLKKTKPNIGISHSSFYSPLAGKFANIPTLYLNDNEHAKGNLIAFKYANLSILPDCLKGIAMQNGWNTKYNIEYYPGLKEGIYLSQSISCHKKAATNKVFIRLEPWNAEYYNGNDSNLDKLILELKDRYSIIILPRSSEQIKHYQNKQFKNLTIVTKPIPLEKICQEASLFIGAGGSMTREMAILGIPTISIYQDKLLEVDKYLINKKFLLHTTKPCVEQIDNLIKSFTNPNDNELLAMGIYTFNMINKLIGQYAKN